MADRAQARRGVALFLGLLVLLAVLMEGVILKFGFAGVYARGLMWSVGVAGMLTLVLQKRSLTELGWGWGAHRWNVEAYLVPFGYALVGYLLIWGLGFGGFYDTEMVGRIRDAYGVGGWSDGATIVWYFLWLAGSGFIGSLSTALGEEIGWRGFLVPELAKLTSFTGVAFVSGFAWALWHFPIIIWSGAYSNDGAALAPQLFWFALLIVSISFPMAYHRLKSGSLWPAAVLHASHNLYIQSFFTPLTVDTGETAKYIDEFGMMVPLVAAVVGAYYWRKGRREFG